MSNNATGSKSFDRLAVIQLMFFPIIAATGLIGNILICLAVFKLRPRLRVTDVFILNLASTDLATCTISIPFDFVEILTNHWPFGNVLCKIVYPLQTILMAVSVYTLLLMSWERHRSVMPPFRPKIKANRALAVVFFLWIASISLVGPYIAILRVQTDQGKEKCRENWPTEHHSKVFTLAVFVALYLLPLFVITANYIRISQKLWKDIQRMKQTIGERRSCKKPLVRARAQRNMRVVKIFSIAVIAFSFCMLPNHVMWIWYDYGSGNHYPHFDTILVFCHILVYSNSAVNPFIFVFLHSRYYKGICKIRKLSFCSKSEKGHNKKHRSIKEQIRKQSKGKAYTMQHEATHHNYTAKRQFWNNYWRRELVPSYEARRERVAFRRRCEKDGRSVCGLQAFNEGSPCNDGNQLIAVRRKVNFGDVVHIVERRYEAN